MPEDSKSASGANSAPSGAFGASNGGPQRVGQHSVPGGSPPNTQRAPIDPSNHVGGVHSLGNGAPDGGSFPSTHGGGTDHSKPDHGGPQRIPGDRAPESGDGQGS